MEVAKERFILRIAGSKHDHQHVLLQQISRDLRNEVEAFLYCKSRDDADKRPVNIGFIQTKFFEEIEFAFALSFKILSRVMSGDPRISRRIPFLVVHAIENAREICRPPADNRIKSETVLRSLNLLRIFAADRGDPVGIDQSTLHEVHLVVKLKAINGKEIPAKNQPRHGVCGEDTLISEIVNGENARHLIEC